MRGLLVVLDRISAALVFAAMVVSGTCVAGLILVNTFDTAGRAFFNKPMLGALEISEVLLAVCIVLAIPYAQRYREHIEIDIFKRFFGPGLARILSIVVFVLTIGVFAMLSLQSYESAIEAVATFEVSAGYVRVPVWIGKVAVAVGFVIALFEAMRQFLEGLVYGSPQTAAVQPAGT